MRMMNLGLYDDLCGAIPMANQEHFVPNPSTTMSITPFQEPQAIWPSNGYFNLPTISPFPTPAMVAHTPSPVSTTTELDNSVDSSEAFADDLVLAYINQFLLEDDVDANPRTSALVQDPAFLAVEKPFLDILTATDPAPSPGSLVLPMDYCSKNSCFSERNGYGHFRGGELGDMFVNSQPIWQFDLEGKLQEGSELVERKGESLARKGRKKSHDDDSDLEVGRSKHAALCDEEVLREMFDKVLLCTGDNCELRAPLPSEALCGNEKAEGNRRGRRGRRKAGTYEEDDAVDLTTLLIHCAQAAAINDQRNADELLKKIRQRSSAYGDAGQRLAHCFADGLQARLAGTGSDIYHSLVAKRTSTSDILKAYKLYVTACPFKRISHFFSNQAILNAAQGATSLHIIDYGICYGFQWPCFMQRLSSRPGGPPRLRITGIDLPQPGFRPAERIEATGRWLAEYARMFNVPFEYHAIATKWETIRVEDLNIDRRELLVVNCLYRLRNMMDETVSVDSPRTRVLNTIRKMNPDLFIHGIVNGTYSAPFFVTRFREALFHFSSLFDMLEANASRVDEHRLLIERDLFGREALNVIACEGTERVERPETYKQWQVRNLRAGFRQLPLDEETVKKARYKVNKCYHRDFLVDEDNRWLLQGWKGRLVFAISTWKPD